MKKNYATPMAIVIAGTMISAAICFRPARLRDAANDNVEGAASKEADGDPQGADALIRAMYRDNLVPIELEGWDPPPDGVYTGDDMQRLLDAWEKHWFGSGDRMPTPDSPHDGVI